MHAPHSTLRTPPPALGTAHIEASRGAHLCARCNPVSNGARQVRHLLDLLALIEHPNALPPASALRLGVELIALTTDNRRGFVCEAAERVVQ